MNRCFYILVLLLVIASCSRDVVVGGSDKKPIVFKATVETKGYEATDDNLERFYATAITARFPVDNLPVMELFFKNVEFSRLGDYFYSNPAYYRPADRPLAFMLYYPSEKEIGAEFNWNFSLNYNDKGEPEIEWEYGNYVILKNFSPNPEIAKQQDILYGFAEVLPEDQWVNESGDITNAEMYHTLSQVQINAMAGNSQHTYRIAGVKIANVISKADMQSATSNPWILDTDAISTYVDEFDDTPIILTDQSQSVMNPAGGNAFMLPQGIKEWKPETDPTNIAKGAYLAVKLQVTNELGDVVYPESGVGYSWRAIPVYKSVYSDYWHEGEHMIYTLDFSHGYGYDDPQM